MPRVLVLCPEPNTASSIQEICTTLGAKETRILTDWQSAQRDLFPLSNAPSNDPWLLIFSAEILVSGGFQRLLAASQLLRFMPPHIQSALLIEPEHVGESDKIAKMITAEHVISPPVERNHCGEQIAAIFNAAFKTSVSWNIPTTSKAAAPRTTPQTPPSPNTSQRTTIQLTWPTKGSLEESSLTRLFFIIHHLQLTGILTVSHAGQSATIACNNGLIGTRNATRDTTLAQLPNILLWNQNAAFSFEPRPVHDDRFTAFSNDLSFLTKALQNVDAKLLLQHLHSQFHLYPASTHRVLQSDALPNDADTLLALCQACDGQSNLSSIFLIQQASLGNSIYALAVFAISCDLILLHETPHTPNTHVHYEIIGKPERSAQLQRPPQEALSPEEAMLLHELNARYHLIQSADGYAFFQIMPGCGVKAVDAQRTDFIRHHHPDRYGKSKSPQIKTLAEEIFMQGQEILNDLRERETRKATQPARPQAGSIRAGRVHINKERSPSSRPARAARPPAGQKNPNASSPPPSPTSRFARSTAKPSSTPSRPTAGRSTTRPPSGRTKARPGARPTPSPAAPRPPASRAIRRSGPVGNPNASSPGRLRPNPNASSPGRPRPQRPNASSAPPARQQRPTPHSSSPSRPRPARAQTSPRQQSRPQNKRPAQSRTGPGIPNRQISADHHFKKGENYLKVLRKQHAMEAFKLALNAEPNNGLYKAHYAWARYLVDPSTVQECIKLLNEATRSQAGAADAFMFLGQISLKRNQTMQASKHFRKVLEFDPNNADALRELQVLKKAMGAASSNKEKDKENKTKSSLFGRLFKK